MLVTSPGSALECKRGLFHRPCAQVIVAAHHAAALDRDRRRPFAHAAAGLAAAVPERFARFTVDCGELASIHVPDDVVVRAIGRGRAGRGLAVAERCFRLTRAWVLLSGRSTPGEPRSARGRLRWVRASPIRVRRCKLGVARGVYTGRDETRTWFSDVSVGWSVDRDGVCG